MGTEIAAFTAIVSLGLQIGSSISSSQATAAEIGETIEDYYAAIAETEKKIEETGGEAGRRIGTAKEEGLLSVKELGAQAAHEGRMAMTSAEMIASSEEARLGASGVRAKGSPLLAAQQNVDLAFAAADRTIEQGRSQVGLAGVKLKGGIGDIEAASSLLTERYRRQIQEYLRKIGQLGGGAGGSSNPIQKVEDAIDRARGLI